MTDRDILFFRRATEGKIRGLVAEIHTAFVTVAQRYRARWAFVLPPEVPFE